MSISKSIFDNLNALGFDVYFPATKIGECTSNYVVVKMNGGNEHTSFSTDVDLYSIMCYVPVMKYSELEPYVQSIKQAMKKIYPLVIPTGNQTPSYHDEKIKAHMVSIEYKNYKKI